MPLTDQQIADLIAEPKATVDARDLLKDLQTKVEPVGQSRTALRKVPAAEGGEFVLRVRQNRLDPYDFSIILSHLPEGGTSEFILRRHNGPSHYHRNPIEKTEFVGVCHIHQATLRYQLRGGTAEHYAVPTDRFHDVATGLACMLRDANFEPAAQPSFPDL